MSDLTVLTQQLAKFQINLKMMQVSATTDLSGEENEESRWIFGNIVKN